jgi:hypothetical protein
MFHSNCNLTSKGKKLAMHPSQVLKICNAANSSENIIQKIKKKINLSFQK